MTGRPWDHKPDGREHALEFWREEHPGKPDPSDDALHQWFADIERDCAIERWREDNPDKPLPDDRKALHKWYVEQWQMDVAMFLADWERNEKGVKFN